MTKKQIKKIIEKNDKTKIFCWFKRFQNFKIQYNLKYDDLWLCWILQKYYILYTEYEAYKIENIKADYYIET